MPDYRGATDLPESIIVREILLRLPPKDALRCRAVRKSWRRATSTRDFLLEHHRHQPSLPVIIQSVDIKHGPVFAVFHDEVGAGNQKLRPLLRYETPPRDDASQRLHLHDCRDGLLIASNTVGSGDHERVFYVCNPATRHCAPLPQLAEDDRRLFTTYIAGMYLHRPSGEHRVLSNCLDRPQNNINFYTTSIGSDEPRRFIGWSPLVVEQASLKRLPYSSKIAPVLHRGC